MQRAGERVLRFVSILATATLGGLAMLPSGASARPTEMQASGDCGMDRAAFCDTFDQPHTGGGRTGALDPSLWTVSRHSGLNNGSDMLNMFVPSDAMMCRDRVAGIVPPNDFFFCGPEFGESMHFMEAFNTGGSYVYNSARIRQPFDFEGRTGTIAFDVDAKTAGSHGWWIELWLSDEPIVGPHFDTFQSPPRNGLGIAFSGECGTAIPAGDAGTPEASPANAVIVRNYEVIGPVITWRSAGGATMQHHECYTTGPDMFNHFKVLVNQQRVEVWATDAQAHPHTAPQPPSRLITTFDNLNLSFTRGYVHFQHAQYNPGGGVSQSQTYHWDNIGFDGPVLAPAAQYSIADSLTPGSWPGGINTGYAVDSDGLRGGPKTFTDVDPSNATDALLTFSMMTVQTRSINYRLNDGPWHAWTSPYDTTGIAAAIPVDLAELRAGTNTIDFKSDGNAQRMVVVANIDLTLNGAKNFLQAVGSNAE
jgi:hypothetical protein